MTPSPRHLLAAAATASLLLLTACGGSGSESKEQLPEASAPASEETGTSPSPASSLPSGVPTAPPERPEDEKSLAGAKAFGKYVLEVFFYTRMSNDPSAMQELATGGRCDACEELLEHVAEQQDKGVAYAPQAEYGLRNPRATRVGADIFAAAWDTRMPDFTRVSTGSGKRQGRIQGPDTWTKAMVDMEWREGAFEVVSYGWDVD